jgi:hypothetical protein
MSEELCWLVLPLVGLLSQIGGTWWKAARRYFIPLVTVGLLQLFLGWDILYVPLALHMYGAFTLPITKFGNSIPGDWRNWLWVPFWACVLCSPVLWLSMHTYIIVSLVCAGILTGMVILSNVRATAKWFQWKLVEMFEGMLPLIPICYLITLQP